VTRRAAPLLRFTVTVRFPRSVAVPPAIPREPDRAWSRTRHGAEPWQWRTAWIRPPRREMAAIVTGEVLKRMVALVTDPAPFVTTTRA
jgi:hypothetical protein